MEISHALKRMLRANILTIQNVYHKEVLRSFKADVKDIIEKDIARKFGSVIAKKVTTQKVGYAFIEEDSEVYESKIIVLSLEDMKIILDTVSQLEMEAKFNGNRDGRESVSGELYRKLTQPTTQDPDPN